MKRLNPQGYSLIEVMIAALILASLASAVIATRTFVAKQTVKNTDKSYGTQKAIQMFEELKALVKGQGSSSIDVLDQYSDGTNYNPVLTTDKTVDTGLSGADPSNALSGNRQTNGHWRYLRQIEVDKVANDLYARQIFIRVWRYASDTDPNSPGDLLAEVGGVLRTISNVNYPSQVMDVYAIDINNTPAWWTQEPKIYSLFQGVVNDVQNRNPGFVLRPHYITRSAYGRDSQYVPYINSAQSSAVAAMPWVYFYPGSVPEDGGTLTNFYDPSGLIVDGNLNEDGVKSLASPEKSFTYSYTVADQANHGMRYPDELATYQAVTAAAVAAGKAAPEISYRMLLEEMLSEPASFTNALIVNLHGELLPLPPMRNYSDPAKSPDAYPNVRVVTHPELIYYPGTVSTSVKLRVYAYLDGFNNPTTFTGTSASGDPQVDGISVFLPDLNITNTNAAVTAIIGNASTTYIYDPMAVSSGGAVALGTNTGVSVDSGGNLGAVAWSFQNPVSGTGASAVTGTLITLYNTRETCPLGRNSTGLPSADLLYNTQYIPCSPEMTSLTSVTNPNFTARDLTYSGPASVKNTARWLITLNNVPIPSKGYYTIETRLGAGVTSNSVPPNLSRTYVWVGNLTPPPYTERYQYLGDPRDCPYLDVKVGGIQVPGASLTIDANGYNWYFKQLDTVTDSNGYKGFGQAGAVAGWGPDQDNADMPRYFQTLRNAMLNTTAIWANINGWGEYYFGLGGEYGGNQAPFQHGVSMIQSQFQTTTSATASSYDEILTSGQGWNPSASNKGARVPIDTNGNWYAKYWLGELYPDSLYDTWAVSGNLPTVANAGAFPLKFYRQLFQSVASTNSITGFGRELGKINESSGGGSFYNSNTLFQQQGPNNGTANEQPLTADLYSIFQFPLPTSLSANRPWTIAGGTAGSESGISPYSSTKTDLSVPSVTSPRLFYDSSVGSGWNSAGVVQMSLGTTKTAFVLASGLSPSGDTGNNTIGELALLFMLRTFLDGGQYTGISHIPQLPLVKLYCDSITGQYSQPSVIQLLLTGPVTTGTPLVVPPPRHQLHHSIGAHHRNLVPLPRHQFQHG